MLIILILFIIALFFPFFWLVLIGYIIWLIATSRSRRNKVLSNAIINLIAQGRTEINLPNVYYESAQSYALDNGAELSYMTQKSDPANDTLVFHITFAKKQYSVCVQRWGKGTLLSVNEPADITKFFGQHDSSTVNTNQPQAIKDNFEDDDIDIFEEDIESQYEPEQNDTHRPYQSMKELLGNTPDNPYYNPFEISQQHLDQMTFPKEVYIGDYLFRDAGCAAAIDEMSGVIASHIYKRIKSPIHLYQYINSEIDAAYIASEDNEDAFNLCNESRFLEHEFNGMLSESHLMDEPDSPLCFMDSVISMDLLNIYGATLTTRIRCMIVYKFMRQYREKINEVRLYIAHKGIEIETKNHHPISVRMWQDVIQRIEPEY